MLTRMSQLLGAKGLYLGFCHKLRRVPFPVSVPIFDKVATWPEIVSIHDNFVVGELRDPEIETRLRDATAPVVVDCGINAGVTVRWWLHLNPTARVFGFDMMQEAHDLTCERLHRKGKSYTGITGHFPPRTEKKSPLITLIHSTARIESRAPHEAHSIAYLRPPGSTPCLRLIR